MIATLIVALIVIAIICVIASIIIKVVPMGPPVPTIIWGAVAIVALLLLLRVITGGSLGVSLP